jgi:hypothetical protein
MLTLTSYPYINPYGIVLWLHFVAALVVGGVLFAKYPSSRKGVMLALGFLALFEGLISIPIRFFDGLLLAVLTLTCASILIVVQYIARYRYRLLAGYVFTSIGCIELAVTLAYVENFFRYMALLGFWAAGFCLALITLIGGSSILFLTIRKKRTINA